MDTNKIINNYIEALQARSEMSGDGRLEYAMGFLYSTLKSLKLDSYDLESLQRETQNLQRLINKQD